MKTTLGYAIAAATVLVGAATAAYAAPQYSAGGPGQGLRVDDFLTDAGMFNPQEVADLAGASKVVVFDTGHSWWGTDASYREGEGIAGDSQAIGELRAAIRANPAATAVLAADHISPARVDDIIPGKAGEVWVYVE